MSPQPPIYKLTYPLVPYTPSFLCQGTMVIRDGRIMAIGPDVTVPAGARVVDGRGGVVTPGFIQADSTLGAVEVSQVPASADRATHSRSISAGFDISLDRKSTRLNSSH